MDLQSFGDGRGEGRGETLADIREVLRKLTAGDSLVGVRHDEDMDRFGESLGDDWVC